MVYSKEVEIGGTKLSIETGKLAKQANGSVMVKYGETMVFVAAVASKDAREDVDFFPLSVEYRERSSAAGKIPGGFFKREGRPSEKEILSARLIDRPIRPLFEKGYKNDTQIIALVYSFDGENDADVLGAIGASAALAISDIPFLEPIGEVRVGRINGEFVVNPKHSQMSESDMDLTVAGTADSIMMVEGESEQVSEDDLINALKFAHDEIKKIVQLQNELREACGKEKMTVESKEADEDLAADVKELAYKKYEELVSTVLSKDERSKKNSELNEEVLTALEEKYPEKEGQIKEILHDVEKELMRKRILSEGARLDGRGLTDIRPISVELAILPRTHGSSLFTRGETQSLTTLTLGSKGDEQIIDGLQAEYKKRFLLHYNFPPFSVGETGRFTGPGRREIGHGNLAERALKVVIPEEKDFAYTVRLNSDILESNGSSSMATVCAGSLALMDGGVPIKKAVAGIAMGLVKEEEEYAVLSDILGNEDHLGDMDFKVAGTEDGITAFQMDIKIQGISYEIMEKALAQAKEGRMTILGIMNQAIDKSRDKLSEFAPALLSMKVDTEQIGAVIGPGGKVIQKMQKDFEAEIYIDDSGMINIAAQNQANAEKVRKYIKALTDAPEVGEVYEGKVMKIMDFGAFVEILPNKEGLLHISQIDTTRVNNVRDFLKEGDTVKVKLIKIENGKLSLSRKVLLKENEKKEEKSKSAE